MGNSNSIGFVVNGNINKDKILRTADTIKQEKKTSLVGEAIKERGGVINAMNLTGVLGFVAKLLGGMLTMASPEIRSQIQTWAKELHAASVKTGNPWDEFLASTLVTIFGVSDT